MFETNKGLKNLNFENSNLFRLPARSRYGEGRDFDIRLPAGRQGFRIYSTPDARLARATPG